MSNLLNQTIRQFEVDHKNGSPLHFTRLSHEQRKHVCRCLAQLKVRVVHVCVNKKMLPNGHGLHSQGRLHRYAIRLLLERISWLCRDNHKNIGDGRCKLHFSRCKNLSYEFVTAYVEWLKQTQTQINWQSLDTANLNVANHEQSIWLRTADIAASGIAKALELGPHGLCEDAYARLLRPVAYTHKNGKCLGYGLKFLLPAPAVEVERDNRYEWLSLYQ